MAITTRSRFIYGHTINGDNQFINFTEDGINELSATIEIGSYSLTEFLDAIAVAMNTIGDNTYQVSVNRDTRIITITNEENNNFDLLVTTGTQQPISAFTLMGFLSNKDGADSYDGDIASGFEYLPQYKLQDFVDFVDIEESVQSQVNESSSGQIEVVSYGKKNLMECEITYATDIERAYKGETSGIENQLNGVANLRVFLQYITGKAPIEFIPNRDNNNIFTKCFLDSTPGYRDGTSFRLKELYAQGLAFHFTSGKLVFRRLD